MRAGAFQKQIKESLSPSPKSSGGVGGFFRISQILYGALFAVFGIQGMLGEMKGQLPGGFLVALLLAFLSAICLMPPSFIASGIWYRITALFFWVTLIFFFIGTAYSIFHPEVQAGMGVWLVYFAVLVLPLSLSMHLLRDYRQGG